jgi:cold shock protein
MFVVLNLNEMQGTVKFYNESKGFGFIITEDGEEVFVHVTGLVDKISQNDRVEFEIAQGKKGPNAVDVKLI